VRDATFARSAASWDAVVSLLTDRIDQSVLASAPNLRVIANVAVGVDNIDLAACRVRGVHVTNTPGVLTEATADLAFGLLLAASRRICEGDRLVRSGGFTGWSPSMLLGARVNGMTLGIVGLGRIGQAVARRARGFGMHVLYAERTRKAEPLERALGAHFVSLDALFRESDAVTLHCPLTPETHHLVSASRLAAMKPTAILVNTARGACVDEAALALALARGSLAGAALDVFEDEPRVSAALLTCERVVLSPHIASADQPTREAMARIAIDNVLAVLSRNRASSETK
jgi:glyoxylate reductase